MMMDMKRAAVFFLLFGLLPFASAFVTPTFVTGTGGKVLVERGGTQLFVAASRATTRNTVNFVNFWMHTEANYTACACPSRVPDYVSKSGSKYWDEGEKVIRLSDHWTGQNGVVRIQDCYWRFHPEPSEEEAPLSAACGECLYQDFVKLPGRKKSGRKTLVERGIQSNKKPKGKLQIVAVRITFDNFWRNTKATFAGCEIPARQPDYQSKSGSTYWDEGNGVIRLSDHWTGQHGVTRIADCEWDIDQHHRAKRAIAGKCLYTDFVMRRKKKAGRVGWKKLRN